MKKQPSLASISLAALVGALLGGVVHMCSRKPVHTDGCRQAHLKKQQKNTERVWSKPKFDKEMTDQNELLEELMFLSKVTCEVQRVQHLVLNLGLERIDQIHNQIKFNTQNLIVPPGAFIIEQGRFTSNSQVAMAKRWLRAGPRKFQFFKAAQVKVLIVVTGHACPGLNNTIRDLTNYYNDSYGITEVYGLNDGFNGIDQPWIKLTPELVKDLHFKGGSLLKTGRGKFRLAKVFECLERECVNQLILIGGRGAIRAAKELHQCFIDNRSKIGLAFIPKFPEGGVKHIKSFGQSTIVDAAIEMIERAYAFATSKSMGVGIVKLPGLKSGELAAKATLAAGKAAVCLLPQFEFDMDGKEGLLSFVWERLSNRGHIVIVVSDGASSSCRDRELLCQGTDESGNELPCNIAQYLEMNITELLTSKKIYPNVLRIQGDGLRSTASNSYDSKFASRLALYTAFGLMAGYTLFAVSESSNRLVMIPLELIEGDSNAALTRHSETWQRLISTTGQPSLLNPTQ